MLHRNPDEFLKSIPRDKRIMCLDMGEKQIGIAFSDKTQLIATAHSIYYRRNMSKDLGYLNRVLKENEAGSMVIGLPFTIDEQETEWCKVIIQFANKINKKMQSTHIPTRRKSINISCNSRTKNYWNINHKIKKNR